MKDRISRHQTFAAILDILEKRATCERAQVAAIIARDNRIISSGYNGPPHGSPHCDLGCDTSKSCTRATHAEINAIAYAAKSGTETDNTTLYCSYSPCPACARAIVSAGIKEIYFKKLYDNVDHSMGLEILGLSGVNYYTLR